MARGQEFALWWVVRVVVPLLPVMIEQLFEWYFGYGMFPFPTRTLLVFSLVFPIILFRDVTNDLARHFLVVATILGVILFAFSVFATSPVAGPNANPRAIHWSGFGFLLFLVIWGAIYEWKRLGKKV